MLVTRAYLTHEYFICSQNVVDSILCYYFVSEQVVFELAVGGGGGDENGMKKNHFVVLLADLCAGHPVKTYMLSYC